MEEPISKLYAMPQTPLSAGPDLIEQMKQNTELIEAQSETIRSLSAQVALLSPLVRDGIAMARLVSGSLDKEDQKLLPAEAIDQLSRLLNASYKPQEYFTLLDCAREFELLPGQLKIMHNHYLDKWHLMSSSGSMICDWTPLATAPQFNSPFAALAYFKSHPELLQV